MANITQLSVTLEPIAASQLSVLRNLLELYVHDFSELVPVEIGPEGRFDLVVDERWFTDPDHHPFFVRRAGKLGGFALVRRGSRMTDDASVMDVAEFFVVRGMRRHGVGAAAARALLAAFPGRWEIRVRPNNVVAKHFWLSVAGRAAGRAHTSEATVDGTAWELIQLEV